MVVEERARASLNAFDLEQAPNAVNIHTITAESAALDFCDIFPIGAKSAARPVGG